MTYKDYQQDLRGLESTLTFLREHTLQNQHPLSPRENGEAIIDPDRYLSAYDIESRLGELTDDKKFALKSFASAITSFHRGIRNYRSESKQSLPFKSFLGRWESRIDYIRRDLSQWRDKVRITSFSLTNRLTSAVQESTANMSAAPEDSFMYEAYEGNLRIRVTPNYFTHVLPLFGVKVLDWKSGTAQSGQLGEHSFSRRGTFVEKVATKADGDSTFQYMVLAAGNVETDIDGVANDHGIKVVKFHALETFGRNDDRKFEAVTRFLAFTGDHVDPQGMVGTGTSAKRAYALLKNRIARDLMSKL